MSSAMPPSVTTSGRFFISIGVTEVIGSTPSTFTSDSCSTKARIALSSPLRCSTSSSATAMRARCAIRRTVSASTDMSKPLLAPSHNTPHFCAATTQQPGRRPASRCYSSGMVSIGRLAAAAVAFICAGAPAQAQTVSDFYRGRTVNLVIGYAPGGGYDLYARTLARHIAKHIPGNPSIVVQNMPGAGSIKAANYLYTIAPKDGLSFGGFSRGAFLDPLLGRGEGAQYEAAKFNWLGSISNEVGVCAFRAGAGIKSWQDMRAKPFIIGATGAGADSDVFPVVLRKMFKLQMKLVAGYHSAAEVVIAIKRSEVDGRCGWSWSSLVSWNREMYESKQIDVVLQLAAQK